MSVVVSICWFYGLWATHSTLSSERSNIFYFICDIVSYSWTHTMLPPFPVPIAIDINAIKDKLSFQLRPWQRSFQFWVRAIDIYTGYKVSLSLSLSFSLIFIIMLRLFFCFCSNCNMHSLFRCFKWESISSKMCRSRKQCGNDSTSLPPTKFSPCALTSEVSSSRFPTFRNLFIIVFFFHSFFSVCCVRVIWLLNSFFNRSDFNFWRIFMTWHFGFWHCLIMIDCVDRPMDLMWCRIWCRLPKL